MNAAVSPDTLWTRRVGRHERAFPVRILDVVPIDDAPMPVKGYDPDLHFRVGGVDVPPPSTAIIFQAAFRPRLRDAWRWLTGRRFCVTEISFLSMYEPARCSGFDEALWLMWDDVLRDGLVLAVWTAAILVDGFTFGWLRP